MPRLRARRLVPPDAHAAAAAPTIAAMFTMSLRHAAASRRHARAIRRYAAPYALHAMKRARASVAITSANIRAPYSLRRGLRCARRAASRAVLLSCRKRAMSMFRVP